MMICVFVMVSFFLILLFSNNEWLKSLPFDVKPIVLERLTDYKPLVEDELMKKDSPNIHRLYSA